MFGKTDIIGKGNRDKRFWFDNVNKIYSGDMTRESLRFFDPDQTKCYMDFGVWQNKNINIRSAVLLYDKVYIAFLLIRQSARKR